MRDVAVKTATTAARRLARIEEQIARDAAEIAARPLGDAGSLRRALEALGVDEVAASTALAGIRLERSEITALLARGVALGGKQLTAYEAVADYADAAGVVASHEPIGPRSRRPFVQVDEVVDLHHRALRRTAPAPGAWRARNVPAVESGLVPPAHWLVPREIASNRSTAVTGASRACSATCCSAAWVCRRPRSPTGSPGGTRRRSRPPTPAI